MLDKERSKRKKKKKCFLCQEINFFQYVNDIVEDFHFGQRECHVQVLSYLKRTQLLQFLESLNYF